MRDGSNHCREYDPSGSLVKRGRSLMLLELLDEFAVFFFDPIEARLMTVKPSVSGIGSLVDPTQLRQLIGQLVEFCLDSEQSVLQFHIVRIPHDYWI